jgi:tetratricopeptide (TPR) repeat protein
MSRSSRPFLSIATVLLLFCACATAQQSELPCVEVEIRFKITLSDDRPPGTRLRVQLLNSSGNYVNEVYSDDEGDGQFGVAKPGNYYLRVTGLTVKETTGPAFAVRCNQGAPFQFLSVKRTEEGEKEAQAAQAHEALISSIDLRVPAKARKEFDRGMAAQEQNKIEEAKKRFESAIAIYPDYARAYNHLGVIYNGEGDAARGVAAFEKAVSLNDHYSDALINLAKVHFNRHEMRAAEELLQKALAVEPANLDALGLLVPTQFMSAEYDEAAATAQRVHAAPLHMQYVIVHVIAARALEARNHPEQALAEYQLFLQEAPNALSAPQVRSEVARLKTKLQQ